MGMAILSVDADHPRMERLRMWIIHRLYIIESAHLCYNVDETGLITVQKPVKDVASHGVHSHGVRKVAQMTSAERSTLITACCCVNAIGNSVPPFFIYPRVHFKQHMINSGPAGCVGVANMSGLMNSENFVIWLKHFIDHTRCSKERKVLLLLDNHESQVSATNLDTCKENGIVMVTLPLHCSHKLQPLNRSVFGLLKRYDNASCDS